MPLFGPITHILHTFPLPSEIFIVRQIAGLIQRGIDVKIAAYYHDQFYPEHDLVATLGLRDRCTFMPSVPRNRLLRLGRALSWLSAEPHQVRLRLRPAFNILRYGKDALNLTLIYKAMLLPSLEWSRIIHCQFGNLGEDIVGFKRTGLLRGSLVTSFRGHDATSMLKEKPSRYAELFRYGSMFLPVSNALRELLINAGCPSHKCHVLRGGIPLADYPFRPKIQNLTGRRLVLLTVARLVEMKGVEYGIRALAWLIEQGLDVEYRIIGYGPLEAELKCLVEQLNLRDRVCFLGAREGHQVRDEMTNAAILLSPSVTAANGDQEGIPNVLKEAMALGIPVIATRHGGVPELVQDGASGILVEERDHLGLANAVRVLLSKPDDVFRLVARARIQIEDDYDLDKQTERLIGLYESILGPTK